MVLGLSWRMSKLGGLTSLTEDFIRHVISLRVVKWSGPTIQSSEKPNRSHSASDLINIIKHPLDKVVGDILWHLLDSMTKWKYTYNTQKCIKANLLVGTEFTLKKTSTHTDFRCNQLDTLAAPTGSCKSSSSTAQKQYSVRVRAVKPSCRLKRNEALEQQELIVTRPNTTPVWHWLGLLQLNSASHGSKELSLQNCTGYNTRKWYSTREYIYLLQYKNADRKKTSRRAVHESTSHFSWWEHGASVLFSTQ